MATIFHGFSDPEKQKWTKLPHELIEALPLIKSLGELKVILYVLRHTWGFHEYKTSNFKRITLDEFEYGRRRSDRSRLDSGTGLDRKTIVTALTRAVEHGFLMVQADFRDLARIKKSYRLAYAGEGHFSQAAGEESPFDDGEMPPRSEKETTERNLREINAAGAAIDGLEPELAAPERATLQVVPHYGKQRSPGNARATQPTVRLSPTTALVLRLARETAIDKASARFMKGEQQSLLAYELAFGPAVIVDKANEFKANGEQGRGLIKHVLNFMQQYTPRNTYKGRQQDIAIAPPQQETDRNYDESEYTPIPG